MTINKPKVSMGILLLLSFAHFSNDLFQSIIPAIYPIIKDSLNLNFKQIGLVTLVYQIFASVFQPILGILFDKYPKPYYLIIGFLFTMCGLAVVAFSTNISMLYGAVALVGIGSSIVHPEASRMTHLASGGKHGLAQSIFQVGGSLGGSMGPLLVVVLITPYGQRYVAFVSILVMLCIFGLIPLSKWYRGHIKEHLKSKAEHLKKIIPNPLSKGKTSFALTILMILLFSKYVYMASLTNFYTFYLIEKFEVTKSFSQIALFVFLFSAAVGTFIGGPVGDKIGRKYVIWGSILGAAPFALLLPFCNLTWTIVCSSCVGFILSSAFSAMIVYGQELIPSKLGFISGLFFGFAFGIAGIAASVLGYFAESHGLIEVYNYVCFMPLLGVVALFLPNLKS